MYDNANKKRKMRSILTQVNVFVTGFFQTLHELCIISKCIVLLGFSLCFSSDGTQACWSILSNVSLVSHDVSLSHTHTHARTKLILTNLDKV